MARQSTMDAFLSAAPSIPRKSIARSSSSESTLSCITLNNEATSASADERAAIMSTTPPTSLDSASQVSDLKRDDKAPSDPAAGRSRRARPGVATYNENALSRSTRQAPSASSTDPRRDLSGKTLVSPGKISSDPLVRQSIQLLDLDWRVDALPGEKMDLNRGKLPSGKLGRRASLMQKATAAMDKSKSVLGKRTRDLIEAGKNMGRRTSLRPRDLINETALVEAPEPEPLAKKRRVTDILPAKDEAIPKASSMKSTPATRLSKKIYLKQGLYVGQEQEFDARLKPGQKSRKSQKQQGSADSQPKKRTFLPLPMFAGKRMLETGRDFKMPFDVFNPLPPGQPKPDEWRRTQRNVFVGDAADYWNFSKNKNTEYSTCMCTEESGCGEDCFNRIMFYECDKNNCNIGIDRCKNRAFNQLKERVKMGNKYNMGVEVMKTESKGYGVRSCRTFGPGQIIVEYTGEIITQDECDQRMRTIYKDNECFYLMMFDQNMIIDATRGSIARFVNHSCEPNCRMVKWTVDGKPRMALFAGDNGISTADELTYDYNFDPFSAKNIQECHCGMPSCRGVLGPRPKDREPKDALKPLLKESGGAKRKLKEAVGKGVEEVKSKKRRLSADMNAMLKSATEDRAARAALRANIKGAKSKRVASKLTKTAQVSKQPIKKASSRSLVSAKSGPGGKVTVTVSKRTGTARAKANAASMKSNVVRTIKGGRGNKGRKTIQVVEAGDVFDVPDEE